MAGKAILLSVLFLPLTLSAQVYRCDGPGGLVYSQIPCGENAEQLEIHDPMLRNDEEDTTSIDQRSEEEPVAEPPSAMEGFIATLHRQQREQLAEIDDNVTRLKKLLYAEGDEAPDQSVRNHIVSELLSLKSARESVSRQYDSLIAEASSRTGSLETVN
jgi:hypothetical protein